MEENIPTFSDTRVQFQEVIDFFNRKDIGRRMVESEDHYERPPLSEVVKEFERLQQIQKFLPKYDAFTTERFRQAVGVLILQSVIKKGKS